MVTMPPLTLRVIVRMGRWTITLNEQVFVLPQASRAVTITVFVVPVLKTAPEGGLEVTVGAGSQLSEADKIQVTAALVAQVVINRFVGQLITGSVVSTIRTYCVQVVLWLPQQSTAIRMREMI